MAGRGYSGAGISTLLGLHGLHRDLNQGKHLESTGQRQKQLSLEALIKDKSKLL